MENKKKKIIILSLIILVVLIVVVACILIFKKSNNEQDKTNKNPNQSEETNKPNNDKDKPNDKDDDNSDNNSGDNDNNDNNGNNGENQNPSGSGNDNSGNQGGTTLEPKKIRIYSCRRTKSERGIEVTDSLKLRYHIENGLLSDEVILTIKKIDESGESRIDFYKRWMDELKQIKGVTVTATTSGDKTVFSIKTDYKKIDYSGIDFNDPNRIRFYNDIRSRDNLDTITAYLSATGYTCQPPKEA